eukprot:CAMPEP_0194179790 /NCGR_PEP_ID=MMETSP0154-20130528/13185_1 /TAXON_ID=1049557 /ORGANISM="Thalassiothrix antarctica, Strain L6-D1" /LENGTH=921 /DNA_ID=CAMNT_0038895271 /DNA_START=318 /DNA_END=3083 /DNA_ORIENTATION=+
MLRQEQPDSEDESEWKALIAAFQMYKAAYGDLKVPTRFIVPEMPPWPKNAWGMKLGHRVAAIRATGRYVRDSEEKRKVLEDMGFLWQLRTGRDEKNLTGISMQQIVDAINAYKEQNTIESETFTIPKVFMVPDNNLWPMNTRGMPLGKKIASMKSKSFRKKNEKVVKKLMDLGIQFDGLNEMNNARFQKVFNALKKYLEINGDLLVPQPYIVPEDSPEWPQETWGLRLGARVNAIRCQGTFVNTNPERRVLLDELGFVWHPPLSERGRKRGQKTPPSNEDNSSAGDLSQASQESTIAAMDNLFGPSFDFGREDEGKSEEPIKWDIDGEFTALEEEVDDSWDDSVVMELNLTETLMEAAKKATEAGVIEGISESGVRKKGKQYKKVPLYNDDFGEDYVFADVVEALVIYKKIYGDFSKFSQGGNTDFIIPESKMDVFRDEVPTRRFDAAATSRAAAAIASYEEEGNISESENLIAAEIKRLQEEVESDGFLPLESSSIDPLTATEEILETKKPKIDWPQHLAGMQLGHIVRRIKDGSLEVRHLPERKAVLDAIDFDWGEDKYFLDIPFEKAMCSFYAYYMVRGDMFVWDEFVMPDEDPWPTALAGYAIGKAVKRVRELQNFIEAYHPEKVQMLRMVEFVWFSSLALPLDPSAGGPTLEQRFCQFYGHPNYYELPEIPPTLLQQIIKNGPVTENDDPQLWYKQYYDWEYVKDIWYDLGCRDRAFALNRRGYPITAAEHAEKYGTGYYDDLLELMDELEDITPVQFDNLNGKKKKKLEDRLQGWREKLESTIDFYGEEVTEMIDTIDYYLADPDDRLPDETEPGDKVEAEDVFEDDGAIPDEFDEGSVDEELVDDINNDFEDENDTEEGANSEDENEYNQEEIVEEDVDEKAVNVDEKAVNVDEKAVNVDEKTVNVEDELGLGD